MVGISGIGRIFLGVAFSAAIDMCSQLAAIFTGHYTKNQISTTVIVVYGLPYLSFTQTNNELCQNTGRWSM